MSELNQTSEVKKERKKPVRLPLNEVGKLLSKIRIDLDMTSDEFAKQVGVTTVTLNKVERTDAPLTLEMIHSIYPLVPIQYVPEFSDLVAKKLGVLLIPQDATVDAIRTAWVILHTKQQPTVYTAHDENIVEQVKASVE